jgi:hypothetical protein
MWAVSQCITWIAINSEMTKKTNKSSTKESAIIPLDEMTQKDLLESWAKNPRIAPSKPLNRAEKPNPHGIILAPHDRAGMAKGGVTANILVVKKAALEAAGNLAMWPAKMAGDEYGVICTTHGTWCRVFTVVDGPTVSLRKRAVQHIPLTSGRDNRGGKKPLLWPGCPDAWCAGCTSGLKDVHAKVAAET